jgi:hypothetical protein
MMMKLNGDAKNVHKIAISVHPNYHIIGALHVNKQINKNSI